MNIKKITDMVDSSRKWEIQRLDYKLAQVEKWTKRKAFLETQNTTDLTTRLMKMEKTLKDEGFIPDKKEGWDSRMVTGKIKKGEITMDVRGFVQVTKNTVTLDLYRTTTGEWSSYNRSYNRYSSVRALRIAVGKRVQVTNNVLSALINDKK